jgi:hypothetical protein
LKIRCEIIAGLPHTAMQVVRRTTWSLNAFARIRMSSLLIRRRYSESQTPKSPSQLPFNSGGRDRTAVGVCFFPPPCFPCRNDQRIGIHTKSCGTSGCDRSRIVLLLREREEEGPRTTSYVSPVMFMGLIHISYTYRQGTRNSHFGRTTFGRRPIQPHNTRQPANHGKGPAGKVEFCLLWFH